MKPLSETEIVAVEYNLFPLVRPLVRSRLDFPWHRDRYGTVTASLVQSSQALAVEFFGTIDALGSRDAILDAWRTELSLTVNGAWKIELEFTLPRDLLGEPRPTQVDALARSDGGLILFECKFKEADGGGCSQPNPLTEGAHRGMRQCDGSYVDQLNPVSGLRSRCALTGKGIRYWDLVPEVLDIDPAVEHRPCPFAGGWYQWMRNLVAARALTHKCGAPAAFVVVFADGPFPMAHKGRTKEWTELIRLTEGRAVPFCAVSYQHLHSIAAASSSARDRPVLDELSVWMGQKFKTVSAQVEA